MKDLIAQNLYINEPGGVQSIQGPLVGINNVADLINRVVVAFLIPIAGVILFLVFIWGGFDLLTSQGSPDKIKSAKAKITAGIIGFVLLLISFIVVRIIAYVFGLGGGIF